MTDHDALSFIDVQGRFQFIRATRAHTSLYGNSVMVRHGGA